MERIAALGQVRPAAEPVLVARTGAILRQTVRSHEGLRSRPGLCELDASGIRVTDETGVRTISWPDVRSVVADHGRVQVVSPNGPLVLSIALDGVVEPSLAPFFAQVLADARRGTLSSAGALHELTRAIDGVLEGFADADDPVVPLAVGGFAVMAGMILLVAVPFGAQVLARITPPPGAFAILPHLSSLDPRVLLAAFAGGAALAAAVARVALGAASPSWARGTLRGWHLNGAGLEDLARRGIARLVLYPRMTLLVAVIAVLVALPGTFARTIVDADGIHAASGFPLLSTDTAWSAVTDVVPIAVGFGERPEGFVTSLLLADGSRVSTRGRDLVGGSERALYDFSRAHAR